MSLGYVVKDGKKLQNGYTTGSCACGAAKAAVYMLLTQKITKTSFVPTAKEDVTLELDIYDIDLNEAWVSCCVIKDAGDDPDVTHGIKVFAKATKSPANIVIDGGEGVGRVTRNGLKVPVGHAAINPYPMGVMKNELEKLCLEHDYKGGINVIISVPMGEEIAKKTMNPRLGILGGISILGTTGIVEPMSEKALVDTIKTELDMAVARGESSIIITPGNYGRDFAKDALGLDIDKAIKCSNFIGETLDYAVFLGIKRLLFIGHAGKMVKIAGGVMNTHSRIADCRMEIIAAHCGAIGVNKDVIRSILGCVTTDEAFMILANEGISSDVWNSIGERIKFYLNDRCKESIHIDFIVFTQEQGVLFSSVENKESWGLDDF